VDRGKLRSTPANKRGEVSMTEKEINYNLIDAAKLIDDVANSIKKENRSESIEKLLDEILDNTLLITTILRGE
jgi:hypothetical protein